jgi:hypothetical protein
VTHAVSTGWHAAGASGTHDGIPVLVAVGHGCPPCTAELLGRRSRTHAAESLETVRKHWRAEERNLFSTSFAALMMLEYNLSSRMLSTHMFCRVRY